MKGLGLYLGGGAGLDWRQQAVTSPLAVASLTIPVVGWQWWMVLAVTWTINNVGGAVAANPDLTLKTAQLNFWHANSTSVCGAGSSNEVSAGIGAPSQAGTPVNLLVNLAPVVIVGEGSILCSFTGGDGATSVRNASAIIIGRLQRIA